jgi:phosphate starvation-inducible membrane PsiE
MGRFLVSNTELLDNVYFFLQISDKNYAVAGDILDGYLYDLFMNMLGNETIDFL